MKLYFMGIGGTAMGNTALLRQEGWRVGKRQVQRLRRIDGLRVPPTKRRLVYAEDARQDCRPRRAIGAMSGRGTLSRTPRCEAGPYGCSPSLINTPGNAMCSEPTGPSNQAT